ETLGHDRSRMNPFKPSYHGDSPLKPLVVLKPDLNAHLPAQISDQLRACALGNERARVNDADAGTETLSLLHIVGGIQDGRARVTQALDQLEDGAAALRIDADRRLIQD